MHLNTRNMAGVESRAAHKSEAPATEPPVTRAKSNQTKSIVTHARNALLAIVLSPVYQTAIAVVAAAGLVLMEVAK